MHSNKLNKNFNIESLFPDHNTKSNLGELFLSCIIILSVVSLILETESTIHSKYQSFFKTLDIIFFILFSIEYVLRIIFCGKLKKYKGFKGKLRYIISPIALIDLIAILPNILMFLVQDLVLLRMLRLIRMFRIIKLIETNKSLLFFFRSIAKSKSQLISSLIVTLFLLLFGAVVLYIVEGPVQPETFGSIPRAMWWSMATLTTVGYGDVYPITLLGKICASFIALIGIGIVALPAGIIAANFTNELSNNNKNK